MTKRLLFQITLCMVAILSMTSSSHTSTIFVIGDSTAAEKNNPKGSPERGWGMVLQGCFDEKILVDNHAVNGRSSKSFLDQGRWSKVLDKLKPGDYVVIQFGHNDEKPKPDRHTDPGTTFDDHLRRYIRETQAKGATPILMNPVVRRCWWVETVKNDDDEKLRNTTYGSDELINSDTLVDTHGAYAKVQERIAKEMNIPFIDANKITHDIETKMGVVGSRKLHMWFRPGEEPRVPNGKKDNTHYNEYGAHVVANALADAMAEKIKALRKHVQHYDYVVSAEGRGNFMNLQDAVDAVPNGSKATILVLGGKWEKPHVDSKKKIKYKLQFGATIQ